MKQGVADERLIKQYLHGEVTHEQQSEVQDRLLTDPEFFKLLLLLENELTDQYLGGGLSESELKRFDSYFFAAPERRQKLKFAKALNKYVSTAAAYRSQQPLAVAVGPNNWWRHWLDLIRFQNRLLVFSLGTAALVLAAAGVSLVVYRAQLNYEVAQVRDENDLEPAPPVSQIPTQPPSPSISQSNPEAAKKASGAALKSPKASPSRPETKTEPEQTRALLVKPRPKDTPSTRPSGEKTKDRDAQVSIPEDKPAFSKLDKPAFSKSLMAARRLEQPYVLLVDGRTMQPLPLEPTHVGKAEAKGDNLGSLAKEQPTDKLYNGIELAAAARIGLDVDRRFVAIPLLGSSVGVGGTFAGLVHKPKPVTYMWAVPGRSSSLALRSGTPQFEVAYGEVPGVDPDEYEPFVVRLVQTRENWRLVGAKKSDPEAYRSMKWNTYSDFIEERIPTRSNKIARGRFLIALENALDSGEYGIVLRPVLRSKVFLGDDIANRRNSGILFDTVWSFSVAP